MTKDQKKRKEDQSLPKITSKEQKLFDHIHDMVFVDIDYCVDNIYLKPDDSHYTYQWVATSLRQLTDKGYLKVYSVANEEDMKSHKRVYTLDKKGVEEVEAITGISHWDARWTYRTPTYIYHSLRACAIRAAYEMPGNQAQNNRSLKYYDWVSERKAYFQYGASKKEAIRPDGSMIFVRELLEKQQDVYMPFFIEIERSRQSAEVSQKKLERFNAYAQKKSYTKHSGLQVSVNFPPRILFISSTDNEMNRLISHTEGIVTTYIQAVLYTTYDRLRENPYGAIWKAKDANDQDRFYHLTEKIE